ncbi:MAG TPA: fluoride efflux transporter CrcB [Dysgonomonas sp.]|nr:fluoride efflux transporter CrcB [Dysgonomonas sp.]
MIKNILIVGFGGAAGSILRYLTSAVMARHDNYNNYLGIFPWATFTVNILGCILIGLFIGLSGRSEILSPELKLLLITGFCGGYTTFSTFSSENLFLFSNGFYGILTAYVLLSIILGFFGVLLGTALAKLI